MKIKRNFWFIVSFFFFCCIAGTYYQIGFLIRLAYLLSLIMILGGVWSFLSLSGIHFNRIASDTRMECGEIFIENYELNNDSFLPKLWIEIDDESNLPTKGASRVVTNIKPHQKRYYESLTVLTQRGEYLFGPTKIISGDPFGLFQVMRSIPANSKLLVLPLVLEFENLSTRKGTLSGSKARRESITETTPNAGGVREFKPGDSYSRIHWRTSAKKQIWMVKEFDQDPHSDIWLFLDADKFSRYFTGDPLQTRRLEPREAFHFTPNTILPLDSFEYAVTIAASISNYYLKDGRGVGLISFGQKLITLPPERGERQREKIVEDLTFLQPEGEITISTLIRSAEDKINKGNSVIAISTSADPSLTDDLGHLLRKGIPVTYYWLEPNNFGGSEEHGDFLMRMNQLEIPIIPINHTYDLEKTIQTQFQKLQRYRKPDISG